MKLFEFLTEDLRKHDIPMSDVYSSAWDVGPGMKDMSSMYEIIMRKGIKPTLQKIPLSAVRATQDWVNFPFGGGDPVFPEYEDYPSVIKDGNAYHLIDGHHRTVKKLAKGKDQIKAYVFEL